MFAKKASLAHLLCLLALPAMTATAVASSGLQQMDEDELADVQGTGIGIALEDFRYGMAPTSYAEQIGSAAGAGTTLQQSDFRWYGLTMSGQNTGGSRFHWGNGSGTSVSCTTSGTAGLGCPIGGTVANFAPADNPYVIRAFEYTEIDYEGNTVPLTVYEYLAPTDQENYRFAFWGEIEVDPTGSSDLLKSQTIIRGNSSDSVFRIFKFTDPADPTVALFYHSYLEGEFRFSVNQLSGSTSDAQGVAPTFQPTSGLHFRNVQAYLPMGQLHYQGLTLDSARDAGGNIIPDGNFVLELTRVPNEPNVYEHFYGMTGGTDSSGGYNTTMVAIPGVGPASPSWGGGQRSNPGAPLASWYETHGYSRWGDWNPGHCVASPLTGSCSRNSQLTAVDGIFYRSSPQSGNFNASARRPNSLRADNQVVSWNHGNYTDSCGGGRCYYNNRTIVNLGDSRVEGLLVHSLRLTSLGAGI